MPPKTVRGRRKAIIEKVHDGCELETKLIGQDLIKKKANNDDIPSKDKNCNGNYDVEALETEERANKSSDANVLADDMLKEIEDSKEKIKDINVESQINNLSEKDSNLNIEIAALKRGRNKVNASTESGEVPTNTVDSLSLVDENVMSTESSKSDTPDENISEAIKDNGQIEPDTKVDVSEDNKPESKKLPLKRGRQKKVDCEASEKAPVENGEMATKTVDSLSLVDEDKKKSLAKWKQDVMSTESSKSDTPHKNVSEAIQDNGQTEPDTKVDISDDNKPESTKLPLKRGRPKKVAGKPSEKTPVEQLQAEEKVPSKRGRKRANIPTISDKSVALSDRPSKDKKRHYDVEVSETQKKGNESIDINVLADDMLKEVEDSKKVIKDTNVESQISDLSEKDSKRNRKKGIAPAENKEVPTETGDEDKKESLAKRKKNIVITELSKSDTPDENVSETIKDDDQTEPNTKVDVSDDKKPESKKLPLKRGRPKKVDVEASEKTPVEQLQAEEKVPSKRGRNKADIPTISDKSSDLKKIEGVNEEKVPSKRGQKKANILLKSDNSSDMKKIEEDVSEKDSSSVTKDQKSNVNVPSEEKKMPAKRGRRKANEKETVKGFSDKKSDLNLKESSQDMVEEEKSGGNANFATAKKNTRGAKKEDQETSLQSKKLSPVGSKRKQETSNEDLGKNEHGFNGNKILKVALQRNATIDKMWEDRAKVTEKGGARNTKSGSKRAKEDDADSKESGIKSPKIPKGESKSKGQSKKDKMPDVTLLDFSNSSTSPLGTSWNLKISSWNVNGIRAWLEKDGLAYIKHENPDIMAFQETKCSDKMLPKEVNITGYHSYWLAGDKDGYSGVGLLSKEEPVSINYGIGVEEHDNEGRVITAEYETFYFVTAYIPNAGRGLVRLNYRMQWDKDFRSYIKTLDEKKPVVLCGDLNVAHEEIDLANPKSNKKNAGFTKEEREGFSTLLSEGFIDSFRHLYPDEKGAYTFWTYMMGARAKNVGWRLDYFVLSKKFTDHLCDNVIRKDVFGSDHCPITLFLCV